MLAVCWVDPNYARRAVGNRDVVQAELVFPVAESPHGGAHVSWRVEKDSVPERDAQGTVDGLPALPVQESHIAGVEVERVLRAALVDCVFVAHNMTGGRERERE